MIHPMGEIVVVTGAGGAVGRLVVAAARAEPGVERVVAVASPGEGRLATGSSDGSVAEVVAAPFALDDPRLGSLLRGTTRLIHIGARRGPDLDGTGGADVDLVGTRSLLSALAAAGTVRAVVVLSSALVYGARTDNPVPLTEEARVRPNPSIDAAVERAELEAMVAEWAGAQGATCARARPSVVVGPENGRWLARSPWSTSGLGVSGAEAPVQFIHVEDLASALVALCRSAVDGPVNVAPDGWLTAEQVRALKGPAARLRVRRPTAVRLARWGARLGLADADPTTVLAASAPWVVANDRLRSMGWAPTFTNEEAYVDADRGGLWARLTPRHRQELALGAAALAAVGVVGSVALFLRRRLSPPS